MASLRIFKFIGAYTVLGFVPLAVSVFLLPIYASYLTPAQYGILTVANITHTFASLFITLGLDAALGRFYFDYINSEVSRYRLLGTVLFSVIGLTLTLAALLAVAGNWLFAHLWNQLPFYPYGWFVLAGAFSQVVYSLIFTWYRNAENVRMAVAVALTTTACSLAGSIVAIVLIMPNALGALVGKSLGFSLGIAPFALLLLRRVPFSLDLVLLRKLFGYGLPLTGYAILLYLLFNGDRVLMQRWFTLSDLGLYSLAATMISPIEIVLQSCQQAVQPVFYRKLAAQEEGVAAQVGEFYVALVIFNVIALVGLVLLAEPVLSLFKGDRYVGSSYFVAVLAYSQIFRIQYNAFVFPMFFSKNTRLLPAVAVVSIVGGGLVAWVACRMFGTIGIGVGVAGWKAIQAFATRQAMRRTDGVQVEIGRSLPWVFAAGLYVVLLYVVASARPALYFRVSVVSGAMLCFAAILAALRLARRLGLFLKPQVKPNAEVLSG